MSTFIQPSDFVGEFAVTKTFQGSTNLQAYIDYFETKYLTEMLGAGLYELFKEGYEDEEIYTKLYEPFSFDSERKRRPLISYGVKDMLLRLVYAHYCNGDGITPTSGGQVKLDTEAAKKITNAAVYYNTYNAGVQTYKTIQTYIKENLSDYPQFNGMRLGYTWDL